MSPFPLSHYNKIIFNTKDLFVIITLSMHAEHCAFAMRQYAEFVSNVRKAVSAGTDREMAILNAMDRIVAEEQGLSDFFKKHRAEVTDVFLKEYNEDEVHQVFREDGYNEGLEEGLELGLEQGQTTFVKSLSEKGMTISEIASLGDMTVEAVEKILNN